MGITAVGPIVPEHEVLADGNNLRGAVVARPVTNVRLVLELSVQLDTPGADLDRIPGHSDDPLDEVLVGLSGETEYHDVAMPRVAEQEPWSSYFKAPRGQDSLHGGAVDARVGQLVYDQELIVVQRWLHRGAFDFEVLHNRPHGEEDEEGQQDGLDQLPEEASHATGESPTRGHTGGVVQVHVIPGWARGVVPQDIHRDYTPRPAAPRPARIACETTHSSRCSTCGNRVPRLANRSATGAPNLLVGLTEASPVVFQLGARKTRLVESSRRAAREAGCALG